MIDAYSLRKPKTRTINKEKQSIKQDESWKKGKNHFNFSTTNFKCLHSNHSFMFFPVTLVNITILATTYNLSLKDENWNPFIIKKSYSVKAYLDEIILTEFIPHDNFSPINFPFIRLSG